MYRWPMWLGLVLGLGALYAGFSHHSGIEQQWSAATRYTARVGFPLLILAYSARPLFDLTRANWAKVLLANRKWLGLGFAMSHTVHLASIAMLFHTLGETPALVVLVVGGFAYVLLYAMAFTSNRRAMQAMGRRWKQLHRFGIHYLWFIFAQSYVGRIFQDGKFEEGIVGTAIALGAAAIRFAAWKRLGSSKKTKLANP